jgi:predicted permease
MFSNLSIWLIGYVIIQLGKGHGWRGAMGYFKLPMLYVLVAALLARWLRGAAIDWPVWTEKVGAVTLNTLRPLGEAVVPVGLVTLGAQLAQRVRMPNWKIVAPVVMIKLVIFPAVAALVVFFTGLWPWPGAQVIIGCAAPTAVNTLILTVELEGDAETAADCVFWTTVFSAVSITLAMWVIDLYHPPVAGG